MLNQKSEWVIIASLFFLLALGGILQGTMISDEMDILTLAKQFADPTYIPGDFYLEQSGTPRLGFLLLLYPLTRFLSLVTVSIVARLIVYLFLSVSLGLIAHRLKLDSLSIVVVYGVYWWLGQDLLPDADSIFGGVEASKIAYGFLFMALFSLLKDKFKLMAFLAGLAVSIHPIIGIWGSLALGLAVISLKLYTLRERLTSSGIWLAGAALGIIPSLGFLFEKPINLQLDPAEIYVFFRNPHHFVPANWGIAPSELLIAFLLMYFIFAESTRKNHNENIRFIAHVVTWSFVPFIAGIMIVPLENSAQFLQLGLFRVAPTFLLVLGLPIAMHHIQRSFIDKPLWKWVLAYAAIFFIFTAGVDFVDGFASLQEFPKGANQSDWQTTRQRYDVCNWVQTNTEEDALLITSPGRQPIYYLCERPVAVRFKSIPYGKADIVEWYLRLVDFNGGVAMDSVSFSASNEIENNFERLESEQYTELGQKYGGAYLLVRSRDNIDLPLLYDNGDYAVFDLRP